jgi:hypothetical protein
VKTSEGFIDSPQPAFIEITGQNNFAVHGICVDLMQYRSGFSKKNLMSENGEIASREVRIVLA